MRRFRSLIAFVMVIVIQITPWPLGLRPAYSALPILVPVAVGAVVVAAGAINAGSPALYAKAVTGAADAAVDAVSGKITKAMIVALAIGNTKYGYEKNIESELSAVAPVATGNPEYPIVSAALLAAWIDISSPAPVSGNVFALSDGTKKKITSIGAGLQAGPIGYNAPITLAQAMANYFGGGGFSNIGGNRRVNSAISYIYYNPSLSEPFNGVQQFRITYATITTTTTNDPVYPVPSGNVDPVTFAASVAPSQDFVDEIDRLWGNHPGVINPATVPQPFLSPQVKAAAATEAASVAQTAAATAQAAADADPTNTALQVAAAQTATAATQAAIVADAAVAEVASAEAVESESEPEVPPYNPSDLDGPYTLPEVDFGERFRQFINALKGSSIFSLPNSVLGGVPAAGISTMTIQGGQIFGTHVFDFADLSGMWAVLRGIILTGFSFIAVRVVTLKK